MPDKINHSYRYLVVNDDDKRLGIYITGAGITEIQDNIEYPLKEHPNHHYFDWSEGRRLDAFQLLYIHRGSGVFESEFSGQQEINAGDAFILFPGIWHRFLPNKETGWDEYWVEFNGEIINYYVKENFLDITRPVISITERDELHEKLLKIFQLAKEEKTELQYAGSVVLFDILLKVFSIKKFSEFYRTNIEKQIRQARLYICENISKTISPEEIADKVGMSYSSFRKEFKQYTGFSPLQYQIQIRIQKSKNLLLDSDTKVKEVAYQLGFQSHNYFSRIFKQKIGLSPADFKMKAKK